jgi:hypothetical protein
MRSLDEPPAAVDESQHVPGAEPGARPPRWVPFLILGGALVLVRTILALVRGDWVGAAYDSGAAVVVIAIVGRLWKARSREDATVPAPRESLRLPLFILGCLLGVGLVIAAIHFGRNHPRQGQAEAAGVFEQVAYRNEYLGFRVRYGADWQDVTGWARDQTRGRSSTDVDPSSVLLALSRTADGKPDAAVSVVFTVEPLAGSDDIKTGREYMQRMLPQLQQRAEPPRDIAEEAGTALAGLAFDRMSLKRSWHGEDVAMTYWVAVVRDYALIVQGTYRSPDGLRATEELLARMSQINK